MSTDTEHVDEGTETSPSFLETWADWYHIPVIGAVILFMFWVRARNYERFITEEGTPALAGIDSWYHWRTVEWTAENYPNTMPYEIWTGFPTGNYVGQFGTLFDQLIVTVAMIIGIGDPSTSTLTTAALLTVPVLAALVALPVFYMGRRLGGTIGGIVSILILALAPGEFLRRSVAGQLQHHVAEVLFMALAVLAMMVALRVAEREQPIYELVVDRDWDALREPAIYSALAGAALTLYLWVWPPGIVLIGIFGVFFAVQLCLDYVRGVSPDHVAFVGVISMVVPAVFMLLMVERMTLTSTTSFGFLQPIAALLVAAGCVFMAWLARQWNDRDLETAYYPVAIAGLIVATFGVMWLVLPDLYSTLVGNLTSRLLPLDPGTGTLTIAEAQPPDDFAEHVFNEFGMAFYTMLAGLGLLIARPFLGRELRAEYTLVVVWSLFLISMAATQIRFAYYLVLGVAVVNAVFVADVIRLFDLDLRSSVDSLREVQTYQIIVLVMVVMLLFAPLLPPIAADGNTAMEQSDRINQNHNAVMWAESNEWLAENTPEPGNWGGADNASELDYFGTYDYPEDGDHDYPEGTYGVMSWWDYGHLITTQAERIPHSNPFQQNARSSSAFLTAESEERGELVLDAIAAGESPDDHTTEELESMAAEPTHEELRYVMVDYQMVSTKFPAITEWTGPSYGHYVTPGDGTGQVLNADELEEQFADLPYHDTMLAQLYLDDADGMDHYRVVHEDESMGTAFFASYAEVYDEAAFAERPEQAEQFEALGYEDGDVIYVGEDGQLAPPGQGQPSITVNQLIEDQQQLMAFEQNPTLELVDVEQTSVVKSFERVEGATLTGTVDDEDDVLDENATVTADVELETNADRTFTYTQEVDLADDGSFEVTVPYATDDVLDVDDGYTNSSVEATGEYTISVGQPGEEGYEAGTEVPEPAVIDGETIELDSDDFEQTELEDPEAEEEEDDPDVIDDEDAVEVDPEDDGDETETTGDGE